MKKDRLCHGEEFGVWVSDVLHAVLLLYSVLEWSPSLYETSDGEQPAATYEKFRGSEVIDLHLELQASLFSARSS